MIFEVCNFMMTPGPFLSTSQKNLHMYMLQYSGYQAWLPRYWQSCRPACMPYPITTCLHLCHCKWQPPWSPFMTTLSNQGALPVSCGGLAWVWGTLPLWSLVATHFSTSLFTRHTVCSGNLLTKSFVKLFC